MKLLFFCLIFISGCSADNRAVAGSYPSEGLATWYTAKHTAIGEKFDDKTLSCAMRKRDFGKYYKVCNVENNKCVIVRHNNFGPSLRMFNKGRIIDLSRAAFSGIADLKEGVIKIILSEAADLPH